MVAMTQQPAIKVVGKNGQISIGKEYAGRQVLVEEREPGVWLVRTATVIPDNERWLHEPVSAADLHAAMSWASEHVPSENGVDELISEMRNDQK